MAINLQMEIAFPCPAPYYPPHRWNRGKLGIVDLCEICRGTGLVSASVLATLETRPFSATYDDRGTLLFLAGRELTGRRLGSPS